MCINKDLSAGNILSEEEMKDPLKNHKLYKERLGYFLKNKIPLEKFVEEVWPDEVFRPKTLLLCGCYPPMPKRS